jgi:hypothetical protein
MAMIGRLRSVTAEELAKLQKRPGSMGRFLRGNPSQQIAHMSAVFAKLQAAKADALARGATSDPAEQARFHAHVQKELAAAGLSNGPGPVGFSLDKSWHVLHFLLTGEVADAPPPLGNAILGGTGIGKDMGYGPARFLTRAQVEEVSQALSRVAETELKKRFGAANARAKDLYACHEEGDLALAVEAFPRLREYYAEAVGHGEAMILWVA